MPPDHKPDEHEMSDREKAFADAIARAVVDRFLHALQSEEVAGRAVGNIGAQVDRIIGRALRRLGGYVMIGLIGIGALKLGLLEKLAQLLKP